MIVRRSRGIQNPFCRIEDPVKHWFGQFFGERVTRTGVKTAEQMTAALIERYIDTVTKPGTPALNPSNGHGMINNAFPGRLPERHDDFDWQHVKRLLKPLGAVRNLRWRGLVLGWCTMAGIRDRAVRQF